MVQPHHKILQSAKTHALIQKAVQATLVSEKKAKCRMEGIYALICSM